MLKNYICALDIGSSKIAACLLQLKGRRIVDICFSCVPSRGIRKGIVTNSIELVEAVTKALKDLRNNSGVNIKYVYADISGPELTAKHSRAIIPLAERGNKVITPTDLRHVNEQARILGSGLEEEIIHQVPCGYTIDSSSNILDPIGLYSHRLETDLYLICAKVSVVQSLSRAIHQAGYEIKNLFLSGLATSRAVFDKDSTIGTDILCDIGSDITELLIFKNGVLRDIEILGMGGADLTMRLSHELKIPYELAEDVKISYANIGDYDEGKEILLKKDSSYRPIRQGLICEIVTSKAKSICSTIKERLEKKVSFSEVDNFITSGRTVLLEGFLETLENALEIPVKLGRASYYDHKRFLSYEDPQKASYRRDIHALLSKDDSWSGSKYLTFLTCLGIAYYVLDNVYPLHPPFYKPTRNLFLRAINRFREVYQEYF